MSSPAYNVSDVGNGMSDQFNSTNSNLNVQYDNDNDKVVNSLASSLPTSSTTSTISTSNSSSATFSSTSINNGTDDVCRDYLRNVCRRGKSCRFKHPDPAEAEPVGRKDSMVFCHDFQNRECRRENCRFLHCSKQEEEIFRSTGKLPQNAQTQMASDDAKNNQTPICKDFINGICRRAPGRCKFRHPSQSESFHQSPPPPPPTNRNSFDGRNGQQQQQQRNSNFAMCPSNNSPNLDYYGRQPVAGAGAGGVGAASNMIASSYGYAENYAENPNKRKRAAYDSMYTANNGPYATASYGEPMNQVPPGGYSMQSQYYGRGQMDSRSYLEEENAALRRRIDDLKKQVSELITTNDFLMEQINQLRVQTAATAPATAVAVATATSVASLPPPQAPPPGIVSSTATALGIPTPLSQSLSLQAQGVPPPPPPPGSHAAVIGALPASSIVSSIASISLPTMTAPVNLVNSSAAASLVSYTPSMLSSNAWPLGVDQ